MSSIKCHYNQCPEEGSKDILTQMCKLVQAFTRILDSASKLRRAEEAV